MPVTMPEPVGAPEAIVMPMQSGRATKNTTTEDNASWRRSANLLKGPKDWRFMSKDDGRRAVDAIKQAQARLSSATAAERAYIEALAKRYLGSPRASRAALDKAYADAMRSVWKTFPDDPDAGVLFAEAMESVITNGMWTNQFPPGSVCRSWPLPPMS